tara:strand:+ start:224 stop:484 length:261 start_codon:yes stop_codon:yes gene_type:complete
MAKIPSKLKRQLKRNIRKQDITGSLEKYTRKWAFNVGDMVEYEGETALVVKDESNGYFLLMNHKGTHWRRAAKIRTLRKDPGHAND